MNSLSSFAFKRTFPSKALNELNIDRILKNRIERILEVLNNLQKLPSVHRLRNILRDRLASI